MSDLDAMSEDELRELGQEKGLVIKALRKEMREIQRAHSTKALARKAGERLVAMNTPGAVMAEIEGVAADATAGGETP